MPELKESNPQAKAFKSSREQRRLLAPGASASLRSLPALLGADWRPAEEDQQRSAGGCGGAEAESELGGEFARSKGEGEGDFGFTIGTSPTCQSPEVEKSSRGREWSCLGRTSIFFPRYDGNLDVGIRLV